MSTVVKRLLFFFSQWFLEPAKKKRPKMQWLRTPKKMFENPNDSCRKYERGKLLGEGANGRVYACRVLPATDEFAAVKIVSVKERQSAGSAELPNREAEVLEESRGLPNILYYHESFRDDDDWIYFVTELVLDADTKTSMSLDAYMDRGFSCRKYDRGLVLLVPLMWAFFHFLLDYRVLAVVIAATLIVIGRMLREPIGNYINASFDCPQRFTEHEARIIVSQIADGVQRLHALNIAHRDLKLENVLVYGNLKVKIIDFGWSTIIADGLRTNSMAGTPQYMSPEVACGSGHDCSTDLFSLGKLIFVMLCGKHLAGKPEEITQEDIDAQIFAVTDISADARYVLSKLLRVQPTERISSDALLAHRWLADAPTATSSFYCDFRLPLALLLVYFLFSAQLLVSLLV